jgi:hypothetical protein
MKSNLERKEDRKVGNLETLKRDLETNKKNPQKLAEIAVNGLSNLNIDPASIKAGSMSEEEVKSKIIDYYTVLKNSGLEINFALPASKNPTLLGRSVIAVVKTGKDRYATIDYSDNKSIKTINAKDIIDATQMAAAQSPGAIDSGDVRVLSSNAVKYTHSTLDEMTQNPLLNKDSSKVINAPFDDMNQDKGIKTSVGGNFQEGSNMYHGNYKTLSASFGFENANAVSEKDDAHVKWGLNLGADRIETEKTFRNDSGEKASKEAQYDVLSTRLYGQVENPKIPITSSDNTNVNLQTAEFFDTTAHAVRTQGTITDTDGHKSPVKTFDGDARARSGVVTRVSLENDNVNAQLGGQFAIGFTPGYNPDEKTFQITPDLTYGGQGRLGTNFTPADGIETSIAAQGSLSRISSWDHKSTIASARAEECIGIFGNKAGGTKLCMFQGIDHSNTKIYGHEDQIKRRMTNVGVGLETNLTDISNTGSGAKASVAVGQTNSDIGQGRYVMTKLNILSF